MDKQRLTLAVARPGRWRGIAMLAVAGICCGMLASPVVAQSITDRFKSLFGGGNDASAPSAGGFTASTSFANPAVAIARSLTDTFSGIRPSDAPGFIAAQLAGAMLAAVTDRWLNHGESSN